TLKLSIIMRTPSNRQEFTKEWLQYILNEYENKIRPNAKVVVNTFYVGDACKPGEGFSAVLTKINIEATLLDCVSIVDAVEDPSNGQQITYNLVVKLRPQDPFEIEMNNHLGLNIKEYKIYSSIMAELNNFQAEKAGNEFRINIPKLIYGKQTDDEFVLVMENLKEFGYDLKAMTEGLNLTESKNALEQIARLHAVSYVYNIQYNILQKFPCMNINKILSAALLGSSSAINMALGLLKTRPEMNTMLDKLDSAKHHIENNIKQVLNNLPENKMYVLNHGDFWINNLLLKHTIQNEDDDSTTCDVQLIDWQLSHWGSPAFDLHYFFGSCITPEQRQQYSEQLLQHYHQVFTAVTIRLGAPVPDWTYTKFKQEFDRLALFGFFKSLWFSSLLSEMSKKGRNMNQNTSTNPFLWKIKSALAKIIMPIFFKPSVSEFTMKRLICPMINELISGENPEFTERYLAVLQDADERGLFDVPRS
ncbi:unnamed protein product, partial [Meganyctiphanes norvegica]